jgi:serine/threonine protein kinase
MDVKYQIGELLGTGKFGAVFSGIERRTQTPVAIKIDNANLLKYETSVLNFLRNRGVREIPSVFWFGKYQEYHTLVMTYYEGCIDTIDDDTMSQCIRILKHIHKNGVIHRDIKPANWMWSCAYGAYGRVAGSMEQSSKSNWRIHLIDFGLSTFFLDGDNRHIQKNDADNIIGTPKFVSYYNHIGGNISRRDDLISLGYMYMFLNGGVAWSHLRATTTEIRHPINAEMREMKQLDNLEFENEKIADYMRKMYGLEYDEEPQYMW